MKKAADLQDMLQRAGSTMSSGLHDAGSSITDWYNKIDPEAKKALLRGLVGAGIGGAATAGMAAGTPKDPDEKSHVMGPALLGALLGGGAAAGLPYGAKLMSGAASLPGMNDRKPLGSRGLDMMTYPVSHHPLLTAGLAAGAYGLMGQGGKGLQAARKLIGKVPAGGSKVGTLINFFKAYGKAVPKALVPPAGAAAREPGTLRGMFGIPAGIAAGTVGDKLLEGEY